MQHHAKFVQDHQDFGSRVAVSDGNEDAGVPGHGFPHY